MIVQSLLKVRRQQRRPRRRCSPSLWRAQMLKHGEPNGISVCAVCLGMAWSSRSHCAILPIFQVQHGDTSYSSSKQLAKNLQFQRSTCCAPQTSACHSLPLLTKDGISRCIASYVPSKNHNRLQFWMEGVQWCAVRRVVWNFGSIILNNHLYLVVV
jgi:hypothetical protein